jgi:hypothetical protein
MTYAPPATGSYLMPSYDHSPHVSYAASYHTIAPAPDVYYDDDYEPAHYEWEEHHDERRRR